MHARTGILVLLSLLLLGGASLASAALVSPHYITGIPAFPAGYGAGYVPTIMVPAGTITASPPAFSGNVPGAVHMYTPIQGGDFRLFVNPDWLIADTGNISWADETPSSNSLNPFTYRAPPASRCGL